MNGKVCLSNVYQEVGHCAAVLRVKGPVSYEVNTRTIEDEIVQLNHGHGNL